MKRSEELEPEGGFEGSAAAFAAVFTQDLDRQLPQQGEVVRGSQVAQHAPSAKDKQGIDSVIQTGADGFAWECDFGGIIAGQEESCEKAMQEVLRRVQPSRTRRRIIILNPYRLKRYEVMSGGKT